MIHMQFFLPTHIDCHTVWSVANITMHGAFCLFMCVGFKIDAFQIDQKNGTWHAYKKYSYEIIFLLMKINPRL